MENLYSSTSSLSGWNLGFNMLSTGLGALNSYLQGKLQGINAEFQAKIQGVMQSTQVYNQAIPLYQQIGSQVKSMMHTQAMQYMNSGVDVSQGTAFKVISHTKEQGDLKMQEIRDNVNMTVENINAMSTYNAQVGLQTGIMNGLNNATNRIGNTISMYQQAGVFNTNKNTNTNINNTNTNTNNTNTNKTNTTGGK